MPNTTLPLSPARWSFLKTLRPNATMVHQSCAAHMIANPLGAHLPALPYIQRPGVTYDAGCNKAKRELFPTLSGKSRRRLRIRAGRDLRALA